MNQPVATDLDWQRDRLKKHVAAIHTSGELSLLERKLSNVLLMNAYDDLLTARTHQIPVSALSVILGWEQGQNVPKLKAALKRLASTPIEFDVIGSRTAEDWSVTSIISFGNIKNGICTYRYDEALAEKLYDPSVYATVHIGVQRRFAGNYALALYENCLRYVRVGSTGYWELPTLRRLLGVTQEYYDDFRRLNSKVIDKAVKEINRESDITIKADLAKTGRTVTAVRFLVEPKPQASLLPPDEIEELAGLRDSPTFKKLREHGIGEKLALSFMAEAPERAAEIVALAEAKDRKGEIRSTTAGFIRTLMSEKAEVGKTPYQQKKERDAVAEAEQKYESEMKELRLEFVRRANIAAMNALTAADLLALAQRFIQTPEGEPYLSEFKPTTRDHFVGIARVNFKRWLQTQQLALDLSDEAFQRWRQERARELLARNAGEASST
ncbi:replication initiation protein [Cupriavidus basilensis]